MYAFRRLQLAAKLAVPLAMNWRSSTDAGEALSLQRAWFEREARAVAALSPHLCALRHRPPGGHRLPATSVDAV